MGKINFLGLKVFWQKIAIIENFCHDFFINFFSTKNFLLGLIFGDKNVVKIYICLSQRFKPLCDGSKL